MNQQLKTLIEESMDQNKLIYDYTLPNGDIISERGQIEPNEHLKRDFLKNYEGQKIGYYDRRLNKTVCTLGNGSDKEVGTGNLLAGLLLLARDA